MKSKVVQLLIALALIGIMQLDWWEQPADGNASTASSDEILATAFADKAFDLWVKGSGRVERVLADDNDGSRHQRFTLELNSGQSILIAHNIDLAPRIPDINRGDLVEFNGVYEWNDRGGVVHWTHHDPDGSTPGGWLRHKGAVYK